MKLASKPSSKAEVLEKMLRFHESLLKNNDIQVKSISEAIRQHKGDFNQLRKFFENCIMKDNGRDLAIDLSNGKRSTMELIVIICGSDYFSEEIISRANQNLSGAAKAG